LGKRIVVCGDDFGMNAAIDEGMLRLAAMGRLSAVSCLSLGPSFRAGAPRLARHDVERGLHLNLTQTLEPACDPLPGLRSLILRAYAGRLDTRWLDAQIARQFDAFEAAFGCAPDYVDGHQHVHQLPGVRSRLLAQMARRYGAARRPWLRFTAPGGLDGLPWKAACKARLIGALGAGGLAREAATRGMRTNRRLLGVYGFEGGRRHYARLLQHWLFNARDGDVLMCHPALHETGGDALARQRRAEFDVLACAPLGEWMRANGVRIGRLAD
jgi:predicted glycoside hydrolase/deacetylase ChbG (UPF0249 family)